MQIAKILGSQQGAVLPIQNRLSRHNKLLLCGSHRLRKITLLKHLGCRREFCNHQLLRTPVMLDDHDLHIQTSELAPSGSGRQHHIVCVSFRSVYCKRRQPMRDLELIAMVRPMLQVVQAQISIATRRSGFTKIGLRHQGDTQEAYARR